MRTTTDINPVRPVSHTLTDSNAFVIVAGFQRAARQAGWTNQQINDVTKDCLSGNYHHLVCTLEGYCVG